MYDIIGILCCVMFLLVVYRGYIVKAMRGGDDDSQSARNELSEIIAREREHMAKLESADDPPQQGKS